MECQVFEIAPGRANAYARLRGDGSRRPIILLNHTDVVTADAKDWSVRPFSAEIRDGAMYGRGAQDMKAEGMLHAMAMVALKLEGVPLARDTGQFCHLETSLHDPAFRRRVSDHPDWGPLLRNTISLTVLHGSPQTNVSPAKATAELDVACCLARTPRSFSRNSATSSPTRRSRSNQSRRPTKRTLRPWITSFGVSSSK